MLVTPKATLTCLVHPMLPPGVWMVSTCRPHPPRLLHKANIPTAAYTNVLLRDAWRLSPNLLLSIWSAKSSITTSSFAVNGIEGHPAVTDASTDITIIFDPQTFLPSRIRVYEDHQIFGRSTSDMLLYNCTETDGITFARNIKLLYNEELMILEMLYSSIVINSSLRADFFAGLPSTMINETISGLQPAAAEVSVTHTSAEVFESS